MNPRTMRPKKSAAAPSPPVATYRILTEGGNTLTTEASDKIRTEQS